MTTTKRLERPRQIAATGLIAVFLLLSIVLPVSASIQEFQNAFNPRGYFVTIKSDPDHPQWLRSPFNTGFYRTGSGGQGGGTGDGGSSQKDELGHSNVQYTGEENGIDFVDAADVGTIYAIFDHNPLVSREFLIGYSKDEQAAQLGVIPDFSSYVGNPVRPGPTDPSGGGWWSIPVNLTLGEEQEDGSKAALADGTVYEFAFLRGLQANNGTTCVPMPGDEPGTYKGYIHTPFDDAERAEYDAHKYDEYEFITQIDPPGTSRDKTVDHTIQSVPMRYRIQTYASLKSWNEAPEHVEATELVNSVTEADYASGKYDRDNIEALRSALEELDREAEEEVKYQLQKDADWTILQMLDDLKAALEQGKKPTPVVSFDNYNASLENAETLYNDLKDQVGTEVGQYRKEAVDALKAQIDHAKSTINANSTQVQVDAEEAALDNAVMTALDGIITPPDEIVFTDAATGITVTASRSSLPENARLAVREVVSGSTEYDEMVARVSPTPDAVAIYRIVFFDGQDVVTPTAPVTVQIPLQDQFDQTAPQVYYLDDAASPGQTVDATAPEGYRIFTTQTLGTFVLAGQKQQEKPDDQQPDDQTPDDQKPDDQKPDDQQQPDNNQNNTPNNTPENNTPNNNQNNTPNNNTPNNNNNQNNTPQNNYTPQNNQQQNPVYNNTRTTTRTTRPNVRQTTRILRTTRDNKNNQRTQNEMTTTTIYRTQAAEPTTMTTTRPPTTQPEDTSDLEQDPNQHTLLFIALAIAAVGIGTGGYQLVKDKRENDNNDSGDDMQL